MASSLDRPSFSLHIFKMPFAARALVAHRRRRLLAFAVPCFAAAFAGCDASPRAAAEPAVALTVNLPSIAVAPGEELQDCYTFQAEVRDAAGAFRLGRDLLLRGYRLDASATLHHLIVNASSEEVVPGVTECLPDRIIDRIAGIQSPTASVMLPDGVAIRLPRVLGFGGSLHVVNTSDQAERIHGTLDVYAARPEEVRRLANVIITTNNDIMVPPHAERTITATCLVPFPVDVVAMFSHAHHHLVDLHANLTDGSRLGREVYADDDWEAPPTEYYAPPIHLEAGEGVTYTCTHFNDGDVFITPGFGADSDMCGVTLYYVDDQGTNGCWNDSDVVTAMPHEQ